MDLEANKLRSRHLYEEVFGRGNFAAANELLAQVTSITLRARYRTTASNK
jgi:hypothetical protein